MEAVFEEWKAYAQKKGLKLRNVSLDSIKSNSQLKIVALTGSRRAGKSSVLILFYQMLLKSGNKAAYINLEDSRIKNNKDVLDDILKWFGDEGYLLLDEITSVNDWEGWLARNHEMLKGKLNIITSSSRKTLAKPSKPLRGRMFYYELYPLSFNEFLQFKELNIEKTTSGIGRIEKNLEEYLIYGGFPEAVLLENKTDKVNLLNSYFREIIGLDVAEIANEKVSTVELFGKYVISSPYFSASKCLNFFKSLGYKIAKQTLLHLEQHSQEGYLFFFVPIFSHTMKDRSQYPRKAYSGDTGFFYSINGKVDWGRLFENCVFLTLKKRLSQNQEINYWKNSKGNEADFIIREGLTTKEIIQVTYEIENEKTKEREIIGLVECAKEVGLKKGLIITKDYEDSEVFSGIHIKFIPLWKWLLEDKV